MSKKDKEEKKEKPKGLKAVIDSIRKDYGDGAVIEGNAVVQDVKTISTRCLALDMALGVGGIPRGRITEIYGPESSGKTTLCLELIAEVQSKGGKAAFIDVEHAIHRGYAQNGPGVNFDTLIFAQPDSGEEAMDIAIRLAESGEVDLIVVDSVAALVPQAELDGELGDSVPGAQARLMSKFCRMAKGVVNKSAVALVCTNQIREKVGVFFGSPEVTPGGKALRFYASVRIDIRMIGKASGAKDEEERTGNRVRCKIVKNKVAPPFREAEFDIIYGEGIDHAGAMVEAAETAGIIKRAGSSYKCGDKSFAGKEKLLAYLKENPSAAAAVDNEVKAKHCITIVSEPQRTDEPDSADVDELKLND